MTNSQRAGALVSLVAGGMFAARAWRSLRAIDFADKTVLIFGGSRGLGLIMISHDLNLVRNFCDRVLIMYAGQVVEALPAAELKHARHDYTRGLLAAQPHIGGSRAPLPVLRRDESWKRPLAEVNA